MAFEVFQSAKLDVTRNAAFGGGRESIYPFKEMGEPSTAEDGSKLYASFFVPGRSTKQFSGVAQAAGKRHNATFTVRSAEDNGVAGVLVQRVEYRAPRVLTDAEKAERTAKRAATKAAKAGK